MPHNSQTKSLELLKYSFKKYSAIALFFSFFLLVLLISITVIGDDVYPVIWPRILQAILFGLRFTFLLVNLFRTKMDVYCLCPCAIDSRPLSKLSYYPELGFWYLLGLINTYLVFWWIPIVDIYYFVSFGYNVALFVITLVLDVILFLEFWITKYVLWSKGLVQNVRKVFGSSPLTVQKKTKRKREFRRQ